MFWLNYRKIREKSELKMRMKLSQNSDSLQFWLKKARMNVVNTADECLIAEDFAKSCKKPCIFEAEVMLR